MVLPNQISTGSFPSPGKLHGTINHGPAAAHNFSQIEEQGAYSDDGLEDGSFEAFNSDNVTNEEDQENEGGADLAVSDYQSQYSRYCLERQTTGMRFVYFKDVTEQVKEE